MDDFAKRWQLVYAELDRMQDAAIDKGKKWKTTDPYDPRRDTYRDEWKSAYDDYRRRTTSAYTARKAGIDAIVWKLTHDGE